MATPLDTGIGLISNFSFIFSFLLVYLVVFGVLEKIKFFGDNKGAHALIALMISLLFLFVPEMRGIVGLFAPWLAILFVLLLAVWVSFMFLGVKAETMTEQVAKNGVFIFVLSATILILFLIAMNQQWPDFLIAGQGTGYWDQVKRVVTSSKFLGAIFLLIIATYAAKYLYEGK